MNPEMGEGARGEFGRQDVQGVRHAIEGFIDGIRRLDAALISQVFHPRGTSFSVTPRGICIEEASAWPQIMQDAKSRPEHLFRQPFTARIVAIDVFESAAGARVEWEFETAQIVDFYNLLCLDGVWQIVNQVYCTVSVGEPTR